MQIEIKNKRYIELMIEKCNKANSILNQMLDYEYLKQQVVKDATNKSNQECSIIGVLNIKNKHKRKLEEISSKVLYKLIKSDLQELLGIESIYSVDC